MQPVNIPKLDTAANSESILSKFKTNIDTWEKRIQSLKQEVERAKSPTMDNDLEEIKQLTAFLTGRLTKRLLAVKQYKEELRLKYLKCLEPFYTEEGIARFISHYFDVEVFKQVRVRFKAKKDFEKEVNVLFDLYRVKKTIETITTLQKSVASNEPFPSQFAKEEQAEFLKTLKEIFKLFFLRFVKKEFRKQLYSSLSESQLETEEIVKMRKSGQSYLDPNIFQNTEHREKFITVFFSTLLRTKTSDAIKDLHFNYLNFELLKNEFLTDWMNRKLKGNPEKDRVLQNYKIGGKSVAQMIKENPEKESEILQSLPIEVFNDVAEQVNQNVKEEDKTPVTTFSKNHGLFARIQESFDQVKRIAKFSLEKMDEIKPTTKIWTVKKKAKAPEAPPKAAPEPAKTEEKPAKVQPKIQFGVELLGTGDLGFPFFDMKFESYKPKLAFVEKKMGTDYAKFKDLVWQLFNMLVKEQIIMRSKPCYEWSIPVLFTYDKLQYFLLLGAEITLNSEKEGYKSDFKEHKYRLNPYYVFTTQGKIEKFGKIIDKRTVKKQVFLQYSYANKVIHNTAMGLLSRLVQKPEKAEFKSSTMKLRDEKDTFKELEDLKILLGYKQGDISKIKIPEVLAANEKTEKKPKNINDVAADVKKEMEAAKSKPPEPEKRESEKPQNINDVAAQVKKEMEEAKNKPEEPVDKVENKSQNINDIAAQVKKEMEVEKQKASESKESEQEKPKNLNDVAAQLKKEMEEERAQAAKPKEKDPDKPQSITDVAAQLKKEMEKEKSQQTG